jgi:hypothetical protein
VVGVDMGLDQPFAGEPVLRDEGDDRIGVVVGDAAGRVVDVHDRIDHGAGLGCRILDDVADGVGRLVEKGGDLRLDAEIDCRNDASGHATFIWFSHSPQRLHPTVILFMKL